MLDTDFINPMMMIMQKLVISTKSVEYMPFFLSLASFANGVAWTTYAFLPFDPFIAVSYIFGFHLFLSLFDFFISANSRQGKKYIYRRWSCMSRLKRKLNYSINEKEPFKLFILIMNFSSKKETKISG